MVEFIISIMLANLPDASGCEWVAVETFDLMMYVQYEFDRDTLMQHYYNIGLGSDFEYIFNHAMAYDIETTDELKQTRAFYFSDMYFSECLKLDYY